LDINALAVDETSYFSFKPKLNLDTKIQFQTNAQFVFGFTLDAPSSTTYNTG